ncbi:hypothetical protein GCM10027044_27470 [Hymenobacter ruber]
MVGAGKHGLAPEILDVVQDALIIRSHHHAGQVGLPGLQYHAMNHALAAQIDERLAGQAGGSETGGNQAENHSRKREMRSGKREKSRYEAPNNGTGRG